MAREHKKAASPRAVNPRPMSALYTSHAPPVTTPILRPPAIANVDSCAALQRGMNPLPQELYDEIYELTFTAASGNRLLGYVSISGRQDSQHVKGEPILLRHGPSKLFNGSDTAALLQVDQRSRQRFADSYYGDEDSVFVADSIVALHTWAATRPKHHRALLRRLCVAQISYGDLEELDTTYVGWGFRELVGKTQDSTDEQINAYFERHYGTVHSADALTRMHLTKYGPGWIRTFSKPCDAAFLPFDGDCQRCLRLISINKKKDAVQMDIIQGNPVEQRP